MGKSTSVKSSKKGSSDPLTKVKAAGVTKPADSPKAKSKKVAKEVAEKATKKKSKKVESESESSESSDSEAESSDSSDSESDEEKPKKKAANGKKAAAKKEESSDSSDSESEAESSDSSDSEEEAKPKTKQAKSNGVAKKAESSDSDSDSDSSESDSDEKPAAKAEASSDSSDSDSDSSDSDSDSDEKEEAPKAEEPSKKRKALDDPVIPPKKARTEDMSEQSATLFVGSLAWAVNDDILYQAFSEFPNLTSARVITDREGGRSRGFGYVDFSDAESAKAALEAKNGTELEGRNMNIDFSGKRPERSDNPGDRANDRAQRHGDSLSPESDTLFVGNISFEMDQDTVHAFFATVAEPTSVRLPTDPESGNLKGFGYVSFSSIDDAKKALSELNGQYLGEGSSGRAVRLDYAGQRPQRDGGGGRGGFGGRGGGRGGRGGFSSTNRGGLGDFKGTKVTF